MEQIWHDILHATRSLIKHRGYSVFAILTLGLGIGANVGMFNVFGSLLLPSLPVPRSSEIVEIASQPTSTQPSSAKGLSWPAYLDYVNAQPSALPKLAAYDPHLGAEVGRGNETISAIVTPVTGNYFSILEVQAFRGRVINEQDDNPGSGSDVVVLSHRCWRDLFGGRDEAFGTELRVNEATYTVIGVAPPAFTGLDPENPPDMWIPLSRAGSAFPVLHLLMSDMTSTPFRVFGRLKQGASISQAREQFKTVAAQLGSGKSQMMGWRNLGGRTVPNYWEKPWPGLELMDNARKEALSKYSLLFFGIVGSILLAVAGNLTTMLLARTERQSREFAIRIALGASRWRIARGILMESFLVSGLGTVVGLVFAFFFIRLVMGLTPEELRWHKTIATGVFDGRVLAFGFGIATLVASGFSLAPMMRAGSTDPKLATQMASAGTGGRTSTTYRNLLIVLQMAASVLVLAFTLLLVQSAWNRSKVEFTYDAQRVSTIFWRLPGVPRNPDAEANFRNDFVERLKNLPGVQAAALCYPCRIGMRFNYPNWYDSIAITPDYFGVLNAPLLRGRNFTDLDRSEAPKVAIVNQQMARKFWPNQNPIGQRLEHSRWDGDTVEIVGVVADARKQKPGEREDPILYRPMNQIKIETNTASMRAFPSPVIRTDRGPLSLAEIRAAAKAVNANVVIPEMLTVADDLAAETLNLRMAMWVFAAFAMVSIALTAVGLYGLLSYIASAQTRELGVRLALGAPRTSVLRLMLKRGVVLALVGVVIGVVAEAACPNIFSGALYGVGLWGSLDGLGMHDIPTLVFVSLIVFCVAIAASWIPAWRASRLNPIEAIREE